jgi:hypothetical protein
MKFKLHFTRPQLRLLAVKLAYSPLPAVTLAASLVMADFQVNITTNYPSTLVVPLIEAVLIGTIPYLIFRKLLHSRLAVTLASLIAVPMFYDYEPRIAVFGPILKAILPIADDLIINLLFIILVLGVCGLLGWLANWAAPRLKLNSLKTAQFLIIIVVVMASYSAVALGIQLIALHPQMKALASPIVAQTVKPVATKPDIYYLVLEDYASNPTLKSMYNYDNSPFLDFLSNNGFTVNNAAHSNYPYTEDSIPSTLQMNYLTNVTAAFKAATPTELPMRSIFDNPPIVQTLKKLGYKYLHVGSWWTETRSIPSADVNYDKLFKLQAFGMNRTMSEFESAELTKSVFGRWLSHGLVINKVPIITMSTFTIHSLTDYQMSTLNSIAKAPQQGGRFIFGHIISPHMPFVYNPDGSTPLYSQWEDDIGATVETKYVNQMRYTNQQIQGLIDTIKKNAKQPPIIIIQSDEGPHPRELPDETETYDLTKLSDAKLQQKYGVLAAYDLPGASAQELQSLDSPVNTFRVILDHYFGYSLGTLPDCSFAIKPATKLYSFVNITPRLNPAADSSCAKIHQ